MELLHVALDVTDMETAVDFYTELLGLQVTREAELEGQQMVWVGSDDGGELQLLETDDHDEPAGIDHLAITTDDLDATIEAAIEEWDSSVLMEPQTVGDGARLAFISDPEGYSVELIQEAP